MSEVWVFGYGSLVNRATHDYRAVHPARLRGWRRAWRHTDLRPLAYLTAVPCDGAEIDGAIAAVAETGWPALDAREHAYDRVAVPEVVRDLDAGAAAVPAVLYAIPEGRHGRPTTAHPVLLSYLDVVVQGYLRMFGTDGVTRFFATTDGWEAPIADDRARPLYPRAKVLEPEERALVDRHLAERGCVLVPRPSLSR